MDRKIIGTALTLAALAWPGLAQQAEETRPQQPPAVAERVTVPGEAELELELQTEQQKTLYALGLALSQNLTRLDLGAAELAYLVQGLEDGVLEREPQVSLEEYAPKVQELAQQRFAAAAEAEQAEAQEFLQKMAAEPGATRTESGIVIIPLREGAGPSPVATDVVRVHYHGTLPDGSVFDSSVERGEPVAFPLDQVIPCWTEAMQQLEVGGKARIVCPPDLAYGAQGRPGIPPNSPLIFEVELLGIGPEPEAPSSPSQGEQGGAELPQQLARLR